MSVYWVVIIGTTLVLNVICGVFRSKSDTFWWRLFYIHLPIPFIVWMRLSFNISWKIIPFLVGVAVAGQFGGGMFNNKVTK